MCRSVACVSYFVVLLGLALCPHDAMAFSEKEISDVFGFLDANKDGKISHEEFATGKVSVIYGHLPPPPRDRPTEGNLRFEDLQVNRNFFNTADKNGDGTLSPIEIVDALQFEKISENKDHITLQDLRRFMYQIGR